MERKRYKKKAFDENGNLIIACDRAYYRPLEVNNLLETQIKPDEFWAGDLK